jgi:hypothetical protein
VLKYGLDKLESDKQIGNVVVRVDWIECVKMMRVRVEKNDVVE